MSSTTTNSVLMIEPTAFGFNAATSVSNVFQHQLTAPASEIQSSALREFHRLVEALRRVGVHVVVIRDRDHSQSPDSIFPNNWFSTHENGCLVLYPMAAENRRLERRDDIIDALRDRAIRRHNNFNVVDLRSYEDIGLFLEGTGSLILARDARLVFMAVSDRSSAPVLDVWCKELGYRPVLFHCRTSDAQSIYHTNVMMSIGARIAIVCLDVIADQTERSGLQEQLERCGRTILAISEAQMFYFAANAIQLRGSESEVWTMSSSAWNSLSVEQQRLLEADAEIVVADIPTIEQCGGGSVRCMIAELF